MSLVRISGFSVALSLVLWAPGATALELGDPDAALSVELHGFVSQGFIITTDNNYLARSKGGSFELTEIALNVTKRIGDDLRIGMQIFARDLGPIGNYNAQLDWFYLDYRFADWLGLRAGRVKTPFGLYNELSDIDAARPTVLLPQSIYPIENRDFLLAQTGAELYGYIDIGLLGALEYRVYAGTMFVDVPPQPPAAIQLNRRTNPYLVGSRVMWETPLDGLRVGGSVQQLQLNNFFTLGGVLPLNIEMPAFMWIVSAEYSAHDLLLAAEYSRWDVDFNSSNEALFPSVSAMSERAYVLGAYRITSWLQPSIYYSVFFPSTLIAPGRASVQHDLSATLRFDINAYWLVKLEAHYMYGTAGLNPDLNDGVPVAELPEHWGVFLIKTTAFF